MWVKLSPYLIAMTIGLMIGVERERRMTETEQPMGLRSFLLFSLLGAIAGSIKEPLVSLGMVLFAACATLIGYMRTTRTIDSSLSHVGLTSEIAAMATFGLGYFCNIDPILSLILGVFMLIILLNKPFLHKLTRERLKPKEVQATAILLLLAVGIIPLLPDHTIDPLNIFNPRRLGIIITIVGGIQFLGYAVSRILGRRIGMPLAGFLAGNVSSTAVFATYPKMAQNLKHSYFSVASAATFAIVASLLSLIILLGLISWPVAYALLIPFLFLVGLSLLIGVFLSQHRYQEASKEPLGNPLSIISAIKLGTFLTIMILVVELSERFLGNTMTKLVTFLGALFELQGVAVASANMFLNEKITLDMAASMVWLAVLGSLASKIGLTAFLAKGNYKKVMLIITASLFLVSLILWFLIRYQPNIVLTY